MRALIHRSPTIAAVYMGRRRRAEEVEAHDAVEEPRLVAAGCTGGGSAGARPLGLGGCSDAECAQSGRMVSRHLRRLEERRTRPGRSATSRISKRAASSPIPISATVPAAPDQALSTAEREKHCERASPPTAPTRAIATSSCAPASGAAVAGRGCRRRRRRLPPSRPPRGARRRCSAAAAAPRATRRPRPLGRAAPQEAPLSTRRGAHRARSGALRHRPAQAAAPSIAAGPPSSRERPPRRRPPPPPRICRRRPAPPQSPRAAVASRRLGPGAAPRAASSVPVASITFTGGSATLSAQDGTRLGEVAQMQQQSGGALRVIGHAGRRRRYRGAAELAEPHAWRRTAPKRWRSARGEGITVPDRSSRGRADAGVRLLRRPRARRGLLEH